MTATTPTPARSNEAGDFLRAVARQDWDAADGVCGRIDGPHDAALTRAIATLHMHRHRWAEAKDALDRLGHTEAFASLQRNLCGNLASLRTHRPTVYRAVMDAGVADDYRVHTLISGQQTVARVVDGRAMPSCGDPAAQVQNALTQLKSAIDAGEALALLSISDGHVLAALSARPPQLFLGRQQPIFLLEPDPRLLLTCLQLHDFTGPLGPIEQDRVLWYVGAGWAEALRVDVMTDRYLPFPKINIKQGGAAASIETALEAILEELGRVDGHAAEDVRRHYAALDPQDHAAALAGRAKRSPRVLLLTTRFSTVLQYSTRDADDAFRRLGCQTVVIIEPTAHHILSRSAIRRTLADFKPDLVLQIDHHRFEHGDLFPPGLPFVNWIQDLLPHLMTPSAGRQLGAADFVLTPSLQRWVDEFAYPPRQCFEFRKLTAVPRRPVSWAAVEDRVVYVSNWSQRPEQIKAELLRGLGGETARVVDTACERMIACYAAGDALPTAGHVRRVVLGVMHDLELHADDSLVAQTATRLFDRMNNLLYRQEGLVWAAQACAALGLELQIYGNGWDAHPTLARHARGPVGYGHDLETLTRSAAVNLVLEPFVCVTHQRLLDASVAGGFCLIRGNPATTGLQRLVDLAAAAARPVNSNASLKAALGTGDLAAAFESAKAAFASIDAGATPIDAVAAVTGLQDAGFLPRSGPLLPCLDAVTFDTPQQLCRSLERFTRNAELRSDVVRAQRTAIESRYGYAAGMKRVLAFVRERLEQQTVSQQRAA